jgi:HlyD family secretion protein
LFQGEQATAAPDVRPNPGVSSGQAVYALARLEPASGLRAIGARPGARIEEIKVKEGDEIKQDTVVAILEGHAQAEQQLAVAEAQKKNADHQRAVQRERLALKREAYDRLKGPRLDAANRLNKLTQDRLQQTKDLLPKLNPMIAKDERAKFDLAQTYFQVEFAASKAELDLKELEADQDLQPKQRALEDKELTDDGPDTEVLSRQVELARAGLEQTRVRTPIAGLVLDVLVHSGEVGPGPILTLGNLSSMIARAEVYQSDVPSLAVGDPAEIRIFEKTIAGKVTRIGRTVGGNMLRSLDPRALQDLRVVEVEIALDDAAEASRYVNMQVNVTIKPRRETPAAPNSSRP